MRSTIGAPYAERRGFAGTGSARYWPTRYEELLIELRKDGKMIDRTRHPYMLRMRRNQMGNITLCSTAACALEYACDEDASRKGSEFALFRWNGSDWLPMSEREHILSEARAALIANIPTPDTQDRMMPGRIARIVEDRVDHWRLALEVRGGL